MLNATEPARAALVVDDDDIFRNRLCRAFAARGWEAIGAIGEAWASTPMPAVTFVQSTIHSSQNCGVFQATSTATFAVVTSFWGRIGAT